MIFPDIGELETLNCVVAPPPPLHYRYFYLMQRGQEISEKSPSNQRHMAHQSPEHGEGHGSVGRTTLAQFLLCKGLPDLHFVVCGDTSLLWGRQSSFSKRHPHLDP